MSAKFLIEEDEEGMKRELKEAFRIYDKAGTCFLINYFVCYTIIFWKFTERSCWLLKKYQFLGNGYIPVSSLREILQELDPKLTSNEIDGIIDEIDKDGSGTVDFDGTLFTKYQLFCDLILYEQ